VGCAIGLAIGVIGLVLIASNTRSAPAVAPAMAITPTRRRRSSRVEWAALVEGAALDALAIVKRLASGIAPTEVTTVQRELRDVSERLRALQTVVPLRVDGRTELARLLDVASSGADNEAARLSGVVVMRTDRRAFLAALRALREVSGRLDQAPEPQVAMPRASASGDVAPTFTVA
jgi:hypothetical protein